MCCQSVPQVAEKIDCHYQALDGEPFLFNVGTSETVVQEELENTLYLLV